MFKLIKTEKQYEEYLELAEDLIDLDPEPDSENGDILELLTLLISNYEDIHYPIDFPDPVSAIKFRMDQEGLTQKDLIPYIGSKSKVSEVLGEKRPLSLRMIRTLHENLEIPYDVLLGEEGKPPPINKFGLEWGKFPLSEMLKRKYIPYEGSLNQAKEIAEELISTFLNVSRIDLQEISFCRQQIRSHHKLDNYSLLAWQSRVINKADQITIEEFDKSKLDTFFWTEFNRISLLEDGALLIVSFLNRYGINLIVEKHLPKTYLDGWVTWDKINNPVIALSLRYDRVDNFWFTLVHELGHLLLHFDNEECTSIVDDLDYESKEIIEIEADKFAQNYLIKPDTWNANLLENPKPAIIRLFAEKNKINAAIIAGRIRNELGNYKILSNLVGNGKVRKLFNEFQIVI